MATYNNLKIIEDAGVKSLKLEGRMKNPLYVKTITEEYRKKLDNFNYKTNSLDKVFHRKYTNGFLFNEDKGNIVDYTSSSNEGKLIGNVIKKERIQKKDASAEINCWFSIIGSDYCYVLVWISISF